MISGQPNRIRSEGKGPSLQCSQDQSPDDGEEANRKSDDKASGKRSVIDNFNSIIYLFQSIKKHVKGIEMRQRLTSLIRLGSMDNDNV